MGGTQCADFNATEVTGLEGLCRMGPGDYAGVVTYTDGRVAVTTDHDPDQPDGYYVQPNPTDADRRPIRLDLSGDLIARMRELQGIEFGSCSATGFGSSVSSVAYLPTRSGGLPISWSAEDLRALYAALGQAPGQSSNAFICSDGPNYGRIAINSDSGHASLVSGAIDVFELSCGTLDETHCETMVETLRTIAPVVHHEEDPPSQALQALEYIGGVLMVGLTFFGVHVAGHRYTARADAAEYARDARFDATRARRFAEAANTPEARRLADFADEAATNAETALREGRFREVPRQAQRANTAAEAAADEAERVARERRGGPDDRDPPAEGPGGGTVVPGGSVAPNPGTTARVAVPDAVVGILAFHGGAVVPSADGLTSAVSSTGGPVRVVGPLPVPVITAPIALPTPVVSPRPSVIPRLVPAL